MPIALRGTMGAGRTQSALELITSERIIPSKGQDSTNLKLPSDVKHALAGGIP